MNIDFLRKNKLLFAILIITMMLLSACAGKDGIKTPENTVNSSTSTITDGNGNSVIIPSEVKRIAAAGALNQIILMLGGGDKLVATAKGSDRFFTKVYPRIKEIPAAYTGGAGVLNMEPLLQHIRGFIRGLPPMRRRLKHLNQPI